MLLCEDCLSDLKDPGSLLVFPGGVGSKRAAPHLDIGPFDCVRRNLGYLVLVISIPSPNVAPTDFLSELVG